MKKPQFSIIIPTLNEEKFLPNLLESLSIQTQKNFEVIVVDGKSKDRTVAVAGEYAETIKAMRCVISPKKGVAAQRNYGASLASGEWLLFIDADSVLLPYAMDRIGVYIAKESPQFFTTWFRPDTEEINDAMLILFFNAIYEGARLVKRPFTQGTFAAVKKTIFESVGGYDKAFEFGEDYDLTKRIYERGIPLQVLRETLYVYSLRRYRHQMTLKTMQGGVKAIFSVLLTKNIPRRIPGYIMGGTPYSAKKHSKKTNSFRLRVKKLHAIISDILDY